MAKVQKNHRITQELIDDNPIPDDLTASEFIRDYWKLYKDNYPSNNSLNGTIFENLVIIALAREGIENIYYQTELSFVPTALFDAFLYNEEKSVALSIKVSLRERWKQAELEASALKQVHKKAECYVLSLNEQETRTRQNQSADYAGLDGFILADKPEFDELVEDLKNREFSLAGNVPIIRSSDRVYTDDELLDKFHFKISEEE